MYKYKSAWDYIKSIVNETKIGDIITRKDIMKNANEILQVSFNRNHYTTLDNYRNLLCNHKILTKVGPGAYMKINNIPEHVKLNDLLLTRYSNPLYNSGSSIFDWV